MVLWKLVSFKLKCYRQILTLSLFVETFLPCLYSNFPKFLIRPRKLIFPPLFSIDNLCTNFLSHFSVVIRYPCLIIVAFEQLWLCEFLVKSLFCYCLTDSSYCVILISDSGFTDFIFFYFCPNLQIFTLTIRYLYSTKIAMVKFTLF